MILPANLRMLSIKHKSRINEHKMSQNCKFIQINLHHGKAAMALLCWKLGTGKVDIAFIQEPWVYGDQVKVLHHTRGALFSAGLWAVQEQYRLLLDPAFLSETWFMPFQCWSSVLGMWQWWGWFTLEEGARGNLLLPGNTSSMIQMNHSLQRG